MKNITSGEASNPATPLAYTVAEASSLLRLHPKTVIAMIKREELTGIYFARRWWIPSYAIHDRFDPPIDDRDVDRHG